MQTVAGDCVKRKRACEFEHFLERKENAVILLRQFFAPKTPMALGFGFRKVRLEAGNPSLR